MQHDTIIGNAAVSACDKGEQWELTLGVLAEMAEKTVQQETITCNAAISACEKGCEWQMALGLFSCDGRGDNAANHHSFRISSARLPMSTKMPCAKDNR